MNLKQRINNAIVAFQEKEVVESQPIAEEVATIEKDIDLFFGTLYLNIILNPDPVLITQSGGKGVKLYDDVDRDPHAGSVLQTRYLTVAGRDWDVISVSEDTKDQEIADFVKLTLENINFTQACQELLSAVLYGYSISEIIWEQNSTGVVPTKIIGKHQYRFVFDLERKPRLLTPEDMIIGEELPDRKFIVFTYGSSDNPYGKGLGQKLWWPVWFKKNGIKFWLVFLEKFGMPTTIGRYPPGTPKAQQQSLYDALKSLQKDTAIKIPDSMNVELLEASRGGTATYGEMCSYMDAQISKAVVGQTLTTEVVDKGSYAAATIHKQIMSGILKADADQLEECLNDSLVKWIVDFNFPNIKKYPKFRFRLVDERDLKALAERDKMLHDVGVDIPDSYFREAYALPPVEKGEDVIEGATIGGGTGSFFTEGDKELNNIDRYIENATKDGQRYIDAISDKIINMIDSYPDSTPLDEIARDIEKNYPDIYRSIRSQEFEAHITRAMGAAGMIGNAEIMDEDEED